MIPELRRENTGNLRAGVFYNLLIMDELGQSLLRNEEKAGAISVVSPDDDQSIRVEVVYDPTEWLHECPLDYRHESRARVSSWHADVYTGTRVGKFVPDVVSHRIVVSVEFADLLSQQEFSGLTFEPVPIHVNQSQLEAPQLRAMIFSDAIDYRRPTIFPSEATAVRLTDR